MNLPFDLTFSKQFDQDLEEILDYLTKEASESAAEKVRNEVFKAVETLIDHPERYPPEPLLVKHGNYRVIRLRKVPYEVFYRFTGTEIYVIRIIHSKRDLTRIFKRFKP